MSGYILPYLEGSTLTEEIDMTSTDRLAGGGVYWGGGGRNIEVAGTPVAVYLCPTDWQPNTDVVISKNSDGSPFLLLARNNYPGVADSLCRFTDCFAGDPDYTYGGNGMLYNLSRVRIEQVHDGSSNTLLVGEGTGNMVGLSTTTDQPLHFTWAEQSLADMLYGINGLCSLPGEDIFCWHGNPPAGGCSSWHPGGA